MPPATVPHRRNRPTPVSRLPSYTARPTAAPTTSPTTTANHRLYGHFIRIASLLSREDQTSIAGSLLPDHELTDEAGRPSRSRPRAGRSPAAAASPPT